MVTKIKMRMENKYTKQMKKQKVSFYVQPTVLFTEDDWNTTYEGSIIESSIYSHRVHSQVYGTFWIPKENVRIIDN